MLIQLHLSIRAIISGVMVISSIHPVYSIIWLVMSFINVGALFMLLNVNFVGMILLIVYVGAIAILFIFIIMMLNLTSFESEITNVHILPLSLLIVLSLTSQIMVTNSFSIDSNSSIEFITPTLILPVQAIAQKFYTFFGSYLIISSLILLVAMVGTIVLALSYNQTSKKQDLFTQINRDKFS
uniref:NADH-ubiquinone oxidoreductase chain 6 n=1 Tax=Chrysaora quinquecirrha TaxID=6148 RepID=G8DM10_CHRQI|nr:NADH dehydrogenase subunit 6 [Chrysaora quinquecirrha]ADY15496.1 NADH dehydrogenase subunit 6 [Chrysaora quinquecirrha]